MIRVNPRLSRLLLGTAFAAALCIPASAAPSGEVFVKLPPGSTAAKDDHKDHIEILSYSWGAAANGDMVLKGSKIGENTPAPVSKGRVSPSRVTSIRRGRRFEVGSPLKYCWFTRGV